MRTPAYCPSCGSVFPSPVAVSPGVSIVLNNVITDCPHCGKEASLDGEFRGAESAIEIIKSPHLTPEHLKRFAGVLREAYEVRSTPEQTKKKAVEIDERLGEVVEQIQKDGNKAWATMLLLLIFILSRCNYEVKVSLDINEAIKQMTGNTPAAIMRPVPLPKPDPRPDKRKK